MRVIRIIKEERIYLLIILGTILLASHELFLGSNYITYKDPAILQGYVESNLVSNGWVANRVFGTSFFWADTGLMHNWSLQTLLAEILSSSELSYTVNIFSLIILAKLNDDNLPIIKANGIFKGVNLPAGEGVVTLYFDTSP